ncbi:MAG: NAD-dependent epimerase/dehydratase family protein [Candidatus Lernaella stagnicola]|nr:NAD-dependent epimerase/dehydratase family protein [Candidatus Lernaella stagnicola]
MAPSRKSKEKLIDGLLSKSSKSLADDFRDSMAAPDSGNGRRKKKAKKRTAAPKASLLGRSVSTPAKPRKKKAVSPPVEAVESKPKPKKRARRRGDKKLNILITGVTTSIGRNLVMHLINNKRVGIVLGVAQRDKPYYFNDLPKDKFIYRRCNILKPRELRNLFLSRAFRNAQINTVVHLAFHNQPLRGEDIHRLNVEGTRDLLKKCIDTPGIVKFVFKGSDVVYKLTPHNPIYLDENAPLNFDPNVDQWIKDRVDADMICRSFMDNRRVKIVILRMSNIIGRNINGQFNAYFDSRPVIKTLGFNPMVNLLHMKDVIQAITLALEKNLQGIYNIAGRDTAPITTFTRLNGRRLVSLPEPLMSSFNWMQRKLGLTRYYYSVDKDRQKYTALLDISKAQRELGYRPEGRIEF